ncbi:MAG TPA: EamA family transporter, partial [Gemmatimonadales bacterium]|nr:EamA family transporter [Gemmatimonadales bacterium]
FGSLVGFTAYIWLLGVTSIAKAGTYAYVNPVVAVFLGWAILREPITVRTILAAVVILAGVGLVSLDWKSG